MKNFIVYVNENENAGVEVDKTWRTYEGPSESWEDIEQEVLKELKPGDSIGSIVDITDKDNHFIAN